MTPDPYSSTTDRIVKSAKSSGSDVSAVRYMLIIRDYMGFCGIGFLMRVAHV